MQVNPYLATLNSIPEISALGALFKSCAPVEVTESECEYAVTCVKHIYAKHIVHQFDVTNNMEDQMLKTVTVDMVPEEEGWEEEFAIPEDSIAYQSGGSTFVCMARPEDSHHSGPIQCILKFSTVEVEDGEPLGDGMDDEYQLEDLEVTEADFMKADTTIGLVEFRRQWETFGNDNEVVKKFSLGSDSMQGAVDAVLGLLGMGACEGSNVVPDDVKSHAVNLAGHFILAGKPHLVLARAGIMSTAGKGVQLKVVCRSDDGQLNKTLCTAIR